jgi:hypothetical protein
LPDNKISRRDFLKILYFGITNLAFGGILSKLVNAQPTGQKEALPLTQNPNATALNQTADMPAELSNQTQTTGARVVEDIAPPNRDFETGSIDYWTTEGNAFLNQPIRGDAITAGQIDPAMVRLGGNYWQDLPYAIVGYQGQYLAMGRGIGSLCSQEFTLPQTTWAGTYNFISFLLGYVGPLPTDSRVDLQIKATRFRPPSLGSGAEGSTKEEYWETYSSVNPTDSSGVLIYRVISVPPEKRGSRARICIRSFRGAILVDDFRFTSTRLR